MVHILGVNLPESHLARFALTNFYGVGHKTAHRLCARLQVHDKCKVKDLTPFQITALASFLSSPATASPVPRYPLASPDFVPPPPSIPMQQLQAQWKDKMAQWDAKRVTQRKPPLAKAFDPLKKLKVEAELKREIRENIAHQRMIGSYVGRRHAMHLPVRGQNTQSNAKTARKLNQVERYA